MRVVVSGVARPQRSMRFRGRSYMAFVLTPEPPIALPSPPPSSATAPKSQEHLPASPKLAEPPPPPACLGEACAYPPVTEGRQKRLITEGPATPRRRRSRSHRRRSVYRLRPSSGRHSGRRGRRSGSNRSGAQCCRANGRPSLERRRVPSAPDRGKSRKGWSCRRWGGWL